MHLIVRPRHPAGGVCFITASAVDNLRWSKNGQYIEADGIERSVTIGSDSLDAKMYELEDELEKGQHI